jgi:hypothetical protein
VLGIDSQCGLCLEVPPLHKKELASSDMTRQVSTCLRLQFAALTSLTAVCPGGNVRRLSSWQHALGRGIASLL